MTARPPIIVLGAHRSGTSALSRVLDELGVFVGSRLDSNHESWFFLRLNVWLLSRCGGRWDHPAPFRDPRNQFSMMAQQQNRPDVFAAWEREARGNTAFAGERCRILKADFREAAELIADVFQAGFNALAKD